jgi:four helix bundle protein
MRDKGKMPVNSHNNNTSRAKSENFAIRIVNFYKHLCDDKKEYVLSKQILRSGTSIGANLAEAQYAISKKDFQLKVYIALKECAETKCWLDLLYKTNYLTPGEYNSIVSDCSDILHMLIATTKSLKSDKGEAIKDK